MGQNHPEIPGTVIFDGEQAMKGYALNKMCFSFNDAANRAAFVADDPDGQCKFPHLWPPQTGPGKDGGIMKSRR